MKLDYQKELTPVLYGDSAVKLIHLDFIAPRKYGFTMHWHDRMELLLIRSGTLEVNCGNEIKSLGAGEVAIFPPCLPHCGIAGENGVTYDAVMFDVSKFFNSTGASSSFLVPLQAQNISFEHFTDCPEVVGALDKIIELCDKKEPCSDILTVGEIYILIGQLFKSCLSEDGGLITEDGRFKEVLDFINESFCDDISSATLSRKFGYDETYFCRKFKTVTGLSPMIYIRILRLEKAKKLIKSGCALSSVWCECGFSESGYFSRCFKKHYGITPKEYSMKYRK